MAAYRDEEDPFEEDIVFDQAGLLNNTSKMNSAIRRVSSGKCVLFAKTLGLCGAFFGLGLCIAIPGPTFLSPLVDLENNVSPVSPIYVARTSGYVVGSIIGGVLFDRFNRLFLLFLSLLLTAVFITITPWCQVLWILETCMIILGITMGFLDTGGNVLCLDLWGRNSGPFMQALHFSFGLGAFVAPLLAAPFLEPRLANSTFNTDFSHAITEFPVHREDSKTMLYHEGRFRRDDESMKKFSVSGERVKNISNNLLLDIILNTSEVSTNPVLFGEGSTFESKVLSQNILNSISSKHKFVKSSIPNHKPIITDASRLGSRNWNEVHVGIPPASDLLPPISSKPGGSFSSVTSSAATFSSNIHYDDSNTVVFHGGKFKRNVESLTDLLNVGNDEITKNMSNISLFPDITESSSELPISSMSISESSFTVSDSLSESFLNSISTQSTSVKPRLPKRKPTKTDASKLGDKDWEKVHVGMPPPSDLLPLSTSSTLRPSLLPITTDVVTTVSPDVSTSSSSFFSSASTSTDNFSSDISTVSNTMSTDDEVPMIIMKKPSNIFPNDAEKSILSPSSSILTSPPSVVVQFPKTFSSVQSSKDPSVDRTPFVTKDPSLDNVVTRVNEHSTKNNAEDFKEISSANNKNDNYQNSLVFPHSQENISEMSISSALHPRVSSSTMGTSFVGKKDILLNRKQYKAISLNYSSSESDIKMGDVSPLQTMLAGTTNHLPVEKDVFYNSKNPLSSSLYYENTTPDSNSKHQNKSGNVEENTMHSDRFTQKISDKNIVLEKNEISTTFNSVSVSSKLQNREETVSASPLSIASTLSTSTPALSHVHHIHHKPGTFDNDTEHINTIFDIFANRIEKYGFNKIQFTYLIVGIFVFLISLVFLGFLCHNPRDPKSKQEGLGGKKIMNKVVHKLLVPLMAFFFFLYMGLEVTYGQLVLVFATHSNLQLSVVFWGSFAAMRFASIFFASGFSPLTMLMLNFAFCTSGTILVSALANHLETAIWVGTALIGIGLASMFPTGILWIERYIHVSNKVAAVFVIGVALGELICPLAIYHLMVIDRMLFMYAALVMNIVCILTFTLLWWLASHQGEKYSVINNNGYQLANQHDEEEDMMDVSPSGSGVMPRRHCFSSEHRSLLNGNIHRGP